MSIDNIPPLSSGQTSGSTPFQQDVLAMENALSQFQQDINNGDQQALEKDAHTLQICWRHLKHDDTNHLDAPSLKAMETFINIIPGITKHNDFDSLNMLRAALSEHLSLLKGP